MPAIVLMLAALLSTSVQADSATGLVGDYYRGDGRGMNVSLSIKTDGTYFIALDGCLGRYAQAEGVTRVADHILILEAASPPAPGDELMLPSRLLIVRCCCASWIGKSRRAACRSCQPNGGPGCCAHG